MPPDPRNQNSGQPQPSYQPPQYGVNSAPQQSAGGGYDVVPPPVVTGRPGGHNPYEFIFNPDTQKKQGGLLGGNKFLKQILIIVGGAVILIVIIGVIVSALLPKGSSTTDLTSIAQRQQEIVRVASLGKSGAEGQAAKNLALNVALSVQTNQNDLNTYLLQHGTKLSTKVLGLDHTAQTDTTLNTAKSTSTFDTAMIQNLTTQLTTYEGNLKSAYSKASGDKLKALLQKQYNTADLLLKQAKAAS